MVVSLEETEITDILKSLVRMRKEINALREEIDSLIETFEILSDEELVESIERSIKEVKEGKVYNWKDFKRALEEE